MDANKAAIAKTKAALERDRLTKLTNREYDIADKTECCTPTDLVFYPSLDIFLLVGSLISGRSPTEALTPRHTRYTMRLTVAVAALAAIVPLAVAECRECSFRSYLVPLTQSKQGSVYPVLLSLVTLSPCSCFGSLFCSQGLQRTRTV